MVRIHTKEAPPVRVLPLTLVKLEPRSSRIVWWPPRLLVSTLPVTVTWLPLTKVQTQRRTVGALVVGTRGDSLAGLLTGRLRTAIPAGTRASYETKIEGGLTNGVRSGGMGSLPCRAWPCLPMRLWTSWEVG